MHWAERERIETKTTRQTNHIWPDWNRKSLSKLFHIGNNKHDQIKIAVWHFFSLKGQSVKLGTIDVSWLCQNALTQACNKTCVVPSYTCWSPEHIIERFIKLSSFKQFHRGCWVSPTDGQLYRRTDHSVIQTDIHSTARLEICVNDPTPWTKLCWGQRWTSVCVGVCRERESCLLDETCDRFIQRTSANTGGHTPLCMHTHTRTHTRTSPHTPLSALQLIDVSVTLDRQVKGAHGPLMSVS